jgi:3-oxoacyl-[acyl-carrier-protein] synthase II
MPCPGRRAHAGCGMSDRAAPCLSTWSIVSALGMGVEPFRAGMRAGSSGLRPLDREAWPGPADRAFLVPDFDARAVLGPRGTRSMDRVTALAVTAVGMLLEQHPGGLVETADGDVGLVLGTGTGSVQSMMDFTRDSLTGEKPYYVDPARFPNTVMNRAAGQCAIWYGLKGPNTTMAGGHAAGLLALRYAMRLLRGGRAGAVMCGAVEEFSVQRSWLEWHGRGEGTAQVPLGEGCAVFLVEPAATAARPHAEVLAVELGVHGDHAPLPDVLARCARAALSRAGLGADDVWAVAPSRGSGGPLCQGEQEGLERALGGRRPRGIPCSELLGDGGGASAAFQLAAVLVTAPDRPEARGRVALVSSVDRDGPVGCALLRMLDPGDGAT